MTDRLVEIKTDHDRILREWGSQAETSQPLTPYAYPEFVIDWLIAEVERLRTIHTDTLKTDMDFLQRTQADAERWRYVREHGPSCLYWGSELFGDYDNVTGDEADAAVDAARKA